MASIMAASDRHMGTQTPTIELLKKEMTYVGEVGVEGVEGGGGGSRHLCGVSLWNATQEEGRCQYSS